MGPSIEVVSRHHGQLAGLKSLHSAGRPLAAEWRKAVSMHAMVPPQASEGGCHYAETLGAPAAFPWRLALSTGVQVPTENMKDMD